MREQNRKKEYMEMESGGKVILYSVIGIISLIVLVLSIVLANGQDAEQIDNNLDVGVDNIISKTGDSDEVEEIENVSSEIGKTVEEQEELESEDNKIEESTENIEEIKESDPIIDDSGKIDEVQENVEQQVQSEEKVEEVLEFVMPLEGDVMEVFSKDTLIYSKTLEEWVTHLGIDIKAPKTTVVSSAEAGVIKSIKNDPRYGLTIVVEHNEMYQTVYSNLLSTEFVVVGESVTKGQPIGTVGNTATFEIAEEPHLHFELLENGLQVDPMLYIK